VPSCRQIGELVSSHPPSRVVRSSGSQLPPDECPESNQRGRPNPWRRCVFSHTPWVSRAVKPDASSCAFEPTRLVVKHGSFDKRKAAPSCQLCCAFATTINQNFNIQPNNFTLIVLHPPRSLVFAMRMPTKSNRPTSQAGNLQS
jgi:hypothetical protein